MSRGVNGPAMSHSHPRDSQRYRRHTLVPATLPRLSGSSGQRTVLQRDRMRLRSEAALQSLRCFFSFAAQGGSRLPSSRSLRKRVISGRGWRGGGEGPSAWGSSYASTSENISTSCPFSTVLSLSLLLAPNTKTQMKFLKVDYFCLVIFSIRC